MSDRTFQRVVVTGTSLVCGLGFDLGECWRRILAGETGIRRVQSLDLTGYKATCGSEVDSTQLVEHLRTHGIPTWDRTVDMAQVAATLALLNAGFPGPADTSAADRACGVIFGTGVGCSHSLHTAYRGVVEKGLRGLRPTTVPRCMANAISSMVSLQSALTGPNYVVMSACASSTTAIGIGMRMIRYGDATSVLCGGADAVFEPGTFGSWNNLGIMSPTPDPDQACRPFDDARNGSVLGEGASALLLESLDHATRRGARILAEIIGFGERSDASHITRPTPEGQAESMRRALADAGLTPDAVDYIHAHGTATRANDACEMESMQQVFGNRSIPVPVGATKGFLGHMLGASGAAESVLTIEALRRRILPPNRNLTVTGPAACGWRFVGPQPEPFNGSIAIKNSFGFGGNNAVLVFRAWPGTTA